MLRRRCYNVKSGFPQTGKFADIQAGKWTFCPNLLIRGSDLLNSIIVKLIFREIHQQFYLYPTRYESMVDAGAEKLELKTNKC